MRDKDSRDSIPRAIKRSVRKRCGFGCIKCGCPIYEYHHIVEYSIVKEHKEENLTLLCPTHHADTTHGRLSESIVRQLNENPINRKSEFTGGHSLLFGDNCINICFGSVKFVSWTPFDGTVVPVRVFDKSLIELNREDGFIKLSMNIQDEYGDLILIIDNGELLLSTECWDIEFIGKELIIRDDKRRVRLKLRFALLNTFRSHCSRL